MRNEFQVMRDPTSEAALTLRERRPPPAQLKDATIGLLSIRKERSDEFLDTVALETHVTRIEGVAFRQTHFRQTSAAVSVAGPR